MMGLSVEVPENGNKSPRNENLSPGAVGRSSLDETEECDLAKLLDKPRALNMEGRQRSLDERSLGDFHMSPRGPSRNADNVSCLTDRLENVFIPSRRSSVNTPRSGFSTPRSLAGIEHHPVVGDAGESLRRSLVYFRGQAVGTIAASDNLEEKLNYDQGVYGYPLEIQALFFMALRCAFLLLKHDGEGKEFIERISKRLPALSYHMRTYYWMDFKQLNDIYRYKTEEYSYTAVNKFNVMPDSLPEWVFDFMPNRGGYFIGNVGPAKMDIRWFCLGNCIAILSSMATAEQSTAIMDLIEARWEELVGEMPLKVCYPAIESRDWRIITGCDPKNTRWSYHNGGSWPVLLWLLTAACIKTGRPLIARRAIDLAEARLLKDNWPEYYDGKQGRYVGKQARKYQTWSIAGYLVAKMMLEDPSHLGMISLEEDKQMKPVMKRSTSWNT